MISVGVLALSIKYPLVGLFFSFSAMSSFFNLIPAQLFSNSFINKTWDIGFVIFIFVSISILVNNTKSFRTIHIPPYFKFFSIYLLICVVSFLFTIVKYPFPILDAIRTFRYQLGYLFIPVLLLYFFNTSETDQTKNFIIVVKAIYYFLFLLLILYIIQFLSQWPIFTGYSRSFTIAGKSYLRSIPNFFSICFFFLWFNLGAWFTNNRLMPAGKLYVLLCFCAALFTFTRGIYLSVAFTLIMLCYLIFKSHKFNQSRLIVSIIVTFTVLSAALLTGYLNPFLNRVSTISKVTTLNSREDTFRYRLELLRDRINLINHENPFLGLGFIHNKYGYKFGVFNGNYDEDIDGPSLSCADIAWGNIVYRTGWIGFGSFIIFIIITLCYTFIRVNPRINVDSLFLFELATLLELIRNIILTLNSEIYTGRSTQNIALLFAVGIFSYSIKYKVISLKNPYATHNINQISSNF